MSTRKILLDGDNEFRASPDEPGDKAFVLSDTTRFALTQFFFTSSFEGHGFDEQQKAALSHLEDLLDQ